MWIRKTFKPALIAVLFCCQAHAATDLHDYATYIPIGANDWLTVQWTEPDTKNAEEYEFRLWSFERNVYSHQATTKALTHTFQILKSGHYVAEVRACRGTGETRNCSEWARSINLENMVQVQRPDGTWYTRAWWIYQYLRGPGAPVITTQPKH